MKLIVGLGNIGDKYQKTRHNVGFMILDTLRAQHDLSEWKQEKKFFGEVSVGFIDAQKIILLKPHTMMNLSGKSVRAVIDFYKIDPGGVLVVYDDKDMEFGKLRFRETGSHGGHNGMRDIIKHIGSENIARVKFGVSNAHFTEHGQETADFVLSNFTTDEQKQIKEVLLEEACEKVVDWLKN